MTDEIISDLATKYANTILCSKERDCVTGAYPDPCFIHGCLQEFGMELQQALSSRGDAGTQTAGESEFELAREWLMRERHPAVQRVNQHALMSAEEFRESTESLWQMVHIQLFGLIQHLADYASSRVASLQQELSDLVGAGNEIATLRAKQVEQLEAQVASLQRELDHAKKASENCCGDAHMELESVMRHIKELGFSEEIREDEHFVEHLWKNVRAETAESKLSTLTGIARELAEAVGGFVGEMIDGQNVPSLGAIDDLKAALQKFIEWRNGEKQK